jgi:adenylate cyclase
LEAFDDFLRAGEYAWRPTNDKDDNVKAQQWLEKAIALDPKYAEAYASLGWRYMYSTWNQWSDPRMDLQHASELGQKALDLDESNSDALALLCEVDWMHKRYDQAVADGKRAVAINPNYAEGYQALADTLIIYGDPEAAIRAAQEALRLDPTGKDLHSMSIGFAYVLMGRYEDAVSILKHDVTVFPNIMPTHLFLIQSYVELGREKDARAAAAEVMRMSPQFTLASMPVARGAARDKLVRDDLRKAGLK